MIYFQYKSSNEFALLTTQKVFDGISTKVISQIKTYDKTSEIFLNIAKNIKNVEDVPNTSQRHVLLSSITSFIKDENYIYGIYIGYSNDEFYMLYNLDLSPKMRASHNAPKKAKWLIEKNIIKDNKIISYKEFIDKSFVSITTREDITSYKPSQRPWYKKAITSNSIIRTQPYMFSNPVVPGVTYAKALNKKKGIVLGIDVTLSSLSQLLASQNLVEGSASFIYNKDGKLLGQADNISNKQIANVHKQYPNIFVKDGEVLDLEKQKIITINGRKYFKYTTLLKSAYRTQDYLSILSPMDIIMKPYTDKIYEAIALTLFIITLLVSPIIFYTVRLIVGPILQLQKENNKIQEGNFQQIQPVNSFMLEIKSLSISLVNMANSIEESQRTLESKVQMRTADLEIAKKEVEVIHKHTRDSIEYASLIQGAILPNENLMAKYFKDYFVHWMPKDTVGGDIWLFDELRHDNECLLFFIDCTGHGVPGAFVTMIVKAVEREIVAKIMESPNMDVSPAWIMSYFNNTMKQLLQQVTKDSKSNAGWDGGVIYYNKKEQILKFAGAETPLFYVDADGEFKTLKGNRYSVGYKKCAMDYAYKETIIKVKEGMKFYCTTDGYLDQNGGVKGFPFGKKRFGNIIKECHSKPMLDQKEVFLDEMATYEEMIPNNDRNDDMTVIVFEIGPKSK